MHAYPRACSHARTLAHTHARTQRREKDEWDQEYDRGRLKKVKTKQESTFHLHVAEVGKANWARAKGKPGEARPLGKRGRRQQRQQQEAAAAGESEGGRRGKGGGSSRGRGRSRRGGGKGGKRKFRPRNSYL